MSATVTSLVVACGVFLAGYCALVFFPKLPTHHRTNETRDVVRLGIGIVSLLTSLVLGLLIALAGLVIREMWQPWRDVVRVDGADDPGGGVFDGAPDFWGRQPVEIYERDWVEFVEDPADQIDLRK